jgi:predicted RNA-binding Zn-ribbon protein involved in translation (DUF1610 family)
MTKVPPTCWKCGYELSGLKVDDLCPECGCAVWSRPPIQQASQYASRSLTWGIVSIALFFACLGPLAGLLAIPAITYASKANAEVRQGLIDKSQLGGAKAGMILGWITAGLSIAALAVYAILIFGSQFF